MKRYIISLLWDDNEDTWGNSRWGNAYYIVKARDIEEVIKKAALLVALTSGKQYDYTNLAYILSKNAAYINSGQIRISGDYISKRKSRDFTEKEIERFEATVKRFKGMEEESLEKMLGGRAHDFYVGATFDEDYFRHDFKPFFKKT